MKDAKGHGSNPRGAVSAHASGVDQTGRVQRGDYLYHATLTPHLKDIAQTGLRPSPQNANWHFPGVAPTNAVFLSSDLNEAKRFGKLALNNFSYNPGVVLLRTKASGTEQHYNPNPFYGGHQTEFTSGPIHPSKLEFNVRGGKQEKDWRPLRESLK